MIRRRPCKSRVRGAVHMAKTSRVLDHLPADWRDQLRRLKMRQALAKERYGPLQRRVNRSIQVEGLPSRRRPVQAGSVWAVGLVRDEEDIIRGVIQHLLNQDVAGIIVVDNMSSDGTAAILEQLRSETSRLLVGRDLLHEFHQGKKVSYLAHLAWKCGADWIIPFDADEQWFAPSGTLGGFLRRVPRERDVVWADYRAVWPPANGAFAWRGGGTWAVDAHIDPRRKVAFRSRRWVYVGEGNHAVRYGFGEAQTELHMLHYSARSLAQLSKKAKAGVAGLDAAGMDANIGTHWRSWAAANPSEQAELWSRLSEEGSLEGSRVVERLAVKDPTQWSEWDPEGLFG
jgi:hypothetical protein